MGNVKKYFGGSIVFTVISMLLGAIYGYSTNGIAGMIQCVFIMAILSVLEVSLSFDNAVVNAKVLSTMSDVWTRRFLTWGMVVAVFGMRVLFPLLIVSVFAHINMIEALTMALKTPEKYAVTLTQSHILIAGFGGSFLLLVGLSFFFDAEKETHWIRGLENILSNAGSIKSIEIVSTILIVFAVTFGLVPAEQQFPFVIASLIGIVMHEVVMGISGALESFEAKKVSKDIVQGGIMSFIYLEILDSSFSLDGVIGSFVLTNQFVIIALGLGVGAMFVRSLTIMLVDKGTMAEYIYLEHGAFWSIIVLSGIMFASISFEIPEVVTGILSVAFIGSAFVSSLHHNKNNAIN